MLYSAFVLCFSPCVCLFTKDFSFLKEKKELGDGMKERGEKKRKKGRLKDISNTIR